MPTIHRMNSFKGHNFWYIGIHLLQELLQMVRIIVSEHMFLGHAGSDALYHRGMVSSVREEVHTLMEYREKI